MKLKVINKQHNSKDCLVCGMDNPFSLQTMTYELENGLVVGLTKGTFHHQSYPHRMHGGMITALLDEIIGRAINITEPDTFGVTASLEIKFKKPVPLDEPIKVVGKITRNTSRIFEAEGFIESNTGDILAAAHALYVKQTVEKIAGATFSDEDWFLVKDDKDVEYIDIVNADYFNEKHF